MTIFAYLRTAGATRGLDRTTIEAQEEQIERFASEHGLSVNVWRRDRNTSGLVPFPKRASGQKLLSEVQAGDTVFCCAFDRMFISSSDAVEVLDEFKKRGVKVYFFDLGGDIEQLGLRDAIITVLKSIVDQRRVRIKNTSLEKKAQMREQQLYQGGKVPFGYRVNDDQELVKDKLLQECLKLMKVKRKEGLSYRDISGLILKEKGVRVSHTGIRRILSGERKTSD